jgi:putative membrane protein
MDFVINSLQGVLPFVLYFSTAIVLFVLFKVIYAFVTPHKEWELVKDQKSEAAAWAFGGAIIGFCIALGSAATNSVSLVDFIIWGAVALVAQLIAYFIVRLFMPRVSERITNNEISAGIVLGCCSIAIGILNGACMSY